MTTPARLAAVRAVRALEGSTAPYSAQNRNGDGQGLSWGSLQWPQRNGNLGRMLARLAQADPVAWDAITQGHGPELLRVTNASSEAARMAPVAGAVLWAEPWTSRFKALGQHAPFNAIQDTEAATGWHMQTAIRALQRLAPRRWSGRALAVAFDRAVQAPQRLNEAVGRLQARLGGPPLAAPEWPLLDALIEEVASSFGKTSKTYTDIRMRRGNALLSDPSLSDAPLEAL